MLDEEADAPLVRAERRAMMAIFMLPLLIAPVLEPLVVSEKLRMKAAGEGAKTVEEIIAASRRYSRHVILVRIILWCIAIVSWIVFYLLNASYRGYH